MTRSMFLVIIMLQKKLYTCGFSCIFVTVVLFSKFLFILHENKNNNKMKVKAKCNWKERINIGCLEQNQKML